ncbi:YncE family protein [Methylopila henanensis]|uniref:YncE family protein n=1 Tax=Methylopila henanensis TaxID=873516 RepID=A0ABW4K2W1_9HYPH
MTQSRLRIAGVVALALAAGVAGRAFAAEPTIVVVSQKGATLGFLPVGEGEPERVAIGEAPAGVAVGPDGRTLYVTHPDRGRVTVLDAVTRRVAASFPIKGSPFGAAATDESLYVTDWTGNVLHRIEVATGASVGQASVGRSPAAVILDKAGRRAFVAAREADAVSIVDLRTMTETGQIKVGRAPFALALSPDERRLYVANVQSNDLSVVDLESGQELKRVPVGKMPYGVAVTPDGAKIAVTNQHDGTVSIVDGASLAETAKVKVGDYPEGVALTPDGRQAVVANWFDDTLSLIDLASGKVTDTRETAEGPRNLVVVAP